MASARRSSATHVSHSCVAGECTRTDPARPRWSVPADERKRYSVMAVRIEPGAPACRLVMPSNTARQRAAGSAWRRPPRRANTRSMALFCSAPSELLRKAASPLTAAMALLLSSAPSTLSARELHAAKKNCTNDHQDLPRHYNPRVYGLPQPIVLPLSNVFLCDSTVKSKNQHMTMIAIEDTPHSTEPSKHKSGTPPLTAAAWDCRPTAAAAIAARAPAPRPRRSGTRAPRAAHRRPG